MQHNKVACMRLGSYQFGSVTLWSVRHFFRGRCCSALFQATTKSRVHGEQLAKARQQVQEGTTIAKQTEKSIHLVIV